MAIVMVAVVFLALTACANGSGAGAPPFAETESVTIRTVYDQPLTYYVDRPSSGRVPVLLVIDGSSCVGQLRPKSREFWRPPVPDIPVFARVMVEKAGVDPEADHGSACSDEFLKRYSIDARVSDHLRVLQHLRRHADWWNGELYVFGWSDGGDIGGRLLSAYPGVERAVLGGMGGGTTMREHFRDLWVCPEGTEDRPACVEGLEKQFETMIDNPTWKRTWSGQDNSWRVWATRLDARLSILLADDRTPKLIVHGSEDFENTPVTSARRLVADLDEAGSTAHTYWEVPGMAHGWDDLPGDKADALERAMLDWLLNGEARTQDLRVLEVGER
jgi:dienelactone hydrolase